MTDHTAQPDHEHVDWEAVGRQAFENGEHSAPALNATVMAHMAGMPVGTGAIEIMRAFTRGWDAANLAAPVPDLDPQPGSTAPNEENA